MNASQLVEKALEPINESSKYPNIKQSLLYIFLDQEYGRTSFGDEIECGNFSNWMVTYRPLGGIAGLLVGERLEFDGSYVIHAQVNKYELWEEGDNGPDHLIDTFTFAEIPKLVDKIRHYLV